jgi:hypothetical protein
MNRSRQLLVVWGGLYIAFGVTVSTGGVVPNAISIVLGLIHIGHAIAPRAAPAAVLASLELFGSASLVYPSGVVNNLTWRAGSTQSLFVSETAGVLLLYNLLVIAILVGLVFDSDDTDT